MTMELLAASSSIDCGKTPASSSSSCITSVNESVTDEMLALPIIAELANEKRVSEVGFGCNEGHGDVDYEAKLGPLTASYKVTLYKGLPITTSNTTPLVLSSPSCGSGEVVFQKTSYGTARLRHDTKRDLYIVTNKVGPQVGEPPEGEKAGALVLRLTSPKR